MKNLIKITFLLFALFALPILNQAQVIEKQNVEKSKNANQNDNKSKQQFLTDKGGVRLSAFVTYDLEFSEIGNQLAIGNGGSLALIFNRSLYFGFYGMGVVYNLNDYDIALDDIDNFDLDVSGLGHGGLMIGGVIKPSNVFHLDANLKLGVGDLITYNSNNFNEFLYNDFIFIATPHLAAEVNVARWFKVKAGLGYRFASGLRTDRFYNSDYVNSPTANLTFTIGWFGEKKVKCKNKLKGKLFKKQKTVPIVPTGQMAI